MSWVAGARSLGAGIAAGLLALAFSPSALALDEESCLLCHQFDSLAYAESASAEVRHFEVDPALWSQSVHGKVACRDCHRDVTTLPHGPVKPVDCGVTCHVIDPSSNRPFSHQREIERFRASVHGRGAAQDPYAADRPTCLTCHSNRLFAAYEGAWGATDAMVQETLTRCRGCHQSQGWSEYVLMHVMHRMRRRRPPEEVVRLCTSCHEDVQKMARHGLLPMWSFRDSQHWKMILLGDPNAPDCLSCHVPVGYSAHEIQPIQDIQSAINFRNLRATCSNVGGAQQCHPGATQSFAQARIHFTDRQAQEILNDESIDPHVRTLLQQRLETTVAFTRADIFRFWLLGLISGFYKIMIGTVIGLMLLHQIFDFFAHRRHLRLMRAGHVPPAAEPPAPATPPEEKK
jgi:hypothetical protein